MRLKTLALIIIMTAVGSAQAVDFLGIKLCKGMVSTAVTLPPDSGLTIESAEIGAHGALVLLLSSDDTTILNQIDDLMMGFTGSRGKGDEKTLQWSGRKITAFAQVLKPKLAALAVNTSDQCLDVVEDEVVASGGAAVPDTEPGPEVQAGVGETVTAVVPVPASGVIPEPSTAEPGVEASEKADVPGFTLEGSLRHEAFADDWVDVMGVVVNNTSDDLKLATFDLSLWDDTGRLICVDTISVTILKSGQHRAFRDSIRCPGYASTTVARTELQFAGGF
jgi:hypothetical protein